MPQRGRWTSKYENALVDLLMEYNVSHYRGQNDQKLKRYENKSFPLFESLDLLYKGHEEHDAKCQVEKSKHASTSHRAPAFSGRKSKKYGAPIPRVEQTMSAFIDHKREQLESKKHASEEGKQYSISR
uniref:Myb/SANT-like domain-containing protein n=1 Tax=Oryza punctata TaxID=4537 RepID=A0A0E0ML80_ORYPU